jgi:hypothetical protein
MSIPFVFSSISCKFITNTVSAINAKQVKLTGVGLDKLKAEQFSLEGNKVVAYTYNPETKEAILTFENAVPSGKEQVLKLTEKVEGQPDKVTEFKFTYTLEVKSVVANPLVLDDDTADQKLTFKINGEATDADINYLKEAGYTVEFQATTNVFKTDSTAASSSNTGLIDENAAAIAPGQKFAYKVVISKDNQVIESDLVEVKVVDKSSVASSINSYKLVGQNNQEIKSGKLVAGETATIEEIKGDLLDGQKNVNLSGAEFTSSNPGVALVDSTGAITAISPGTTTITIKVGDITKSFNITVVSDARVPSKVTLLPGSVKLVNGQTTNVGVTVVDQYGDPFVGTLIAKDAPVKAVNSKEEVIATVDTSSAITTNEEGKATLTITADNAKYGSGTIEIKKDNTVLATLAVQVSNDTVVASRKLELADPSADLTLDKGNPQDKSLVLVYNKYNASGYLLGKETDIDTASGAKYTVVSSNENVVTVSKETDGSGNFTGGFVVTAVGKGTATISVKEGSVVRATVTVTVNDSTPVLQSVTFKDKAKVVATETVDLDDVFTITADTNDDVLGNVTLSTVSDKKVRVTPGAAANEPVVIYLDADNDGNYNANNDVLLGTVTVFEDITNATADVQNGSVAVDAGDKGNIVFTVKDASGKVIATKVVEVDIPSA